MAVKQDLVLSTTGFHKQIQPGDITPDQVWHSYLDVPPSIDYVNNAVLTDGISAIVALPNAEEYTPGINSLQVFKNGLAQTITDDYTEPTVSSITFASVPVVNSKASFLLTRAFDFLYSRVIRSNTAAQKVFTLPDAQTYTTADDSLQVFLSTVKLLAGTDYDKTNTRQITLVDSVDRGVDVEFKIRSNTSTYYTGTSTATASQTVFTLPASKTYTPGAKELLVYVNGILKTLGASNDYIEAGTTSITFASGLPLGSKVKFYIEDWSGITYYDETSTATASQTSFTLPNSGSYAINSEELNVWVNGVYKTAGASNDYVETNGSSITFNTGLPLGSIVRFRKVG